MMLELPDGCGYPLSLMIMGPPAVVPIRKATLPGQSAKLCICGDYSVTVNQQQELHHHPMPRPEDLMRKLGAGHGFMKIDLAYAYKIQ